MHPKQMSEMKTDDAVEKAAQEIYNANVALGLPDEAIIAKGLFKSGVSWRDQNPSAETLALVEAAKKAIESRYGSLVVLEDALKSWNSKHKGEM